MHESDSKGLGKSTKSTQEQINTSVYSEEVADDVCGPGEKKRTLNRADDYKEEGEGGK